MFWGDVYAVYITVTSPQPSVGVSTTKTEVHSSYHWRSTGCRSEAKYNCRSMALQRLHGLLRETKIASWWLNQPLWKICSSNWIISPGIGVKITNSWNHHLDWEGTNSPKNSCRCYNYRKHRECSSILSHFSHLKCMWTDLFGRLLAEVGSSDLFVLGNIDQQLPKRRYTFPHVNERSLCTIGVFFQKEKGEVPLSHSFFRCDVVIVMDIPSGVDWSS